MTKKEKVDFLIQEGFSTNTLVNLTDKNIDSLYTRLIKEGVEKVQVSSTNPNFKTVVDNLKKQGVEEIEVTENVTKYKKNLVKQKKSNTFVESKKLIKKTLEEMVDSKILVTTTKGQLLEMVKTKIEEKKPN